jgi:hypothetical protein
MSVVLGLNLPTLGFNVGAKLFQLGTLAGGASSAPNVTCN